MTNQVRSDLRESPQHTRPETSILTPDIQSMVDSLPFYVLLVDDHHHILMANEAIRQRTGLDPEEIVGKFCPKVIHGVDGTFPGCPLEEAVEKGQAVEREVFDPATGGWVSSAIYPTGRKTPEGREIFIHMAHDITARKQAEEKIELNYRIQSVLSSVLRISLLNV
ncbi:MAG: PAS domain-containing protein, partial [Candidatus Eisenbacteria bacterium]